MHPSLPSQPYETGAGPYPVGYGCGIDIVHDIGDAAGSNRSPGRGRARNGRPPVIRACLHPLRIVLKSRFQ